MRSLSSLKCEMSLYFYEVLCARPCLGRELPGGSYQTQVLVQLPGNWSLLGFPSFI